MKTDEKARQIVGIDGVSRDVNDERTINLACAAAFAGADGQAVIEYLKSITIKAVAGPHVSSDELRHREGQRFIVAIIDQRIARGHAERITNND